MSQRADCVGDLARRLISRGGEAVVTRVFPKSVYMRVHDDFLLLLWGALKSPMTINMRVGGSGGKAFKVGEVYELRSNRLVSSERTVSVRGSAVHRSRLRSKHKISLPAPESLERGTAILRSLYDVSGSGPLLPEDSAFELFVSRVLVPFSTGRVDRIMDFGGYRVLIGRGGGFTPAGDDFVAGFTATFNFFARCSGTDQVSVPRKDLLSHTVPESGAIVAYSSRGYVDEGMERLILSSLRPGSTTFDDELLSVASRGHTSGVDMALGVLLCEAALAELEGDNGSLTRCLRIIRKP